MTRFVGILLFAFAFFTGARDSHAARVVTDQTGRRVTIPDSPGRLVSLAPSVTETLFALGLADRLVGVTDYCDFPPGARQKPSVGPVLNPSLERIIALKPDLVLGSPAANRRETAERLEGLGIPLYGVTAQTLDETLTSIEDLGRVLGREGEAQTLVAALRRRIEAVEEKLGGRPRPKVLFIVWHRPLTTAGPRTFIGDVIRRAGGASITDDLGGEWPRLSLEEALHRDPDVILLAHSEAFAPGLDEFRHWPGWKNFRAVRDGRIYFISEAIIRPCPRLVDALEEVERALHPAVSSASGKKH